MRSFKTSKGTELPLLNLRGKEYLEVKYRLVWLNEEVPNFEIKTEFLLLEDEQTVCKARVSIFNEEGKVVKYAEATKRETQDDFNDHTEKCETAAVGRALALLGYGTAHTADELDEGERIVDAPAKPVKKKFGKRY